MANTLTIAQTLIRQQNGLYCLNDVHKAAGGNPSHRPGNFLQIDQTKALIAEIQTAGIPAVSTKEGRNGGTYACKELVIAYAAWISAAFHLKVIRVFLDAVQPAQRLPYHVAKDQMQVRYTDLAPTQKVGAGFDSPYAQAAKAAFKLQKVLRLFHFALQFMAARMGGRKPCWFMAPPVRQSVNPFGLPPMIDSVDGSCSYGTTGAVHV